MSSSEKLMILADQEKINTVTVDKMPFTKLMKSNWTVTVTVASNDDATDKKILRGILHLHSKNLITSEPEVNVLDFTEEEFVKFFRVVEQIQEKLDEIYH